VNREGDAGRYDSCCGLGQGRPRAGICVGVAAVRTIASGLPTSSVSARISLSSVTRHQAGLTSSPCQSSSPPLDRSARIPVSRLRSGGGALLAYRAVTRSRDHLQLVHGHTREHLSFSLPCQLDRAKMSYLRHSAQLKLCRPFSPFSPAFLARGVVGVVSTDEVCARPSGRVSGRMDVGFDIRAIQWGPLVRRCDVAVHWRRAQ